MKRREAGARGPAAARPDPPRSPQEAVESTLAGKIAISGLIVFLLMGLLVSNLPESELKDTGRPVVRPLLEATSLSQRWNLFAPNPRQSTLRLEARMTYADGATLTWRPPTGDPVVSEYRSYRWRKWAENVMSDDRQSQWPQVARWVAQHHRRDGQLPTQVVLVRQFYVAPAPGSGDNEVSPWGDDVLFVARYPEEGS